MPLTFILLVLCLLGFAQKLKSDIDESLVAKIAEGDSQAFEAFYQQSYQALYSFVLSITKNHDQTLDIMQETYIKISKSAHSYKAMGKPLAWVFTIARNLCMDHFNKGKRQVDMEDDRMEDSIDLSYHIDDPTDRMVLETALKILKEDEREIVLLYAVNGYKHREIAELLDMKQNTVISKYNRALKKLKNHLEEEVGI